jgi:hypothetical protein
MNSQVTAIVISLINAGYPKEVAENIALTLYKNKHNASVQQSWNKNVSIWDPRIDDASIMAMNRITDNNKTSVFIKLPNGDRVKRSSVRGREYLKTGRGGYKTKQLYPRSR